MRWQLPVATGFLASALVPPLVMCLVLLVDARLLERIPARVTPAGVPPALPKLRPHEH